MLEQMASQDRCQIGPNKLRRSIFLALSVILSARLSYSRCLTARRDYRVQQYGSPCNEDDSQTTQWNTKVINHNGTKHLASCQDPSSEQLAIPAKIGVSGIRQGWERYCKPDCLLGGRFSRAAPGRSGNSAIKLLFRAVASLASGLQRSIEQACPFSEVSSLSAIRGKKSAIRGKNARLNWGVV